jgi:hypothetical protein
MAGGTVDGESVIIAHRLDAQGWTPHAIVRLDVVDRHIVGVKDYTHCRWMLSAATSLDVSLAAGEA